MADEAGFIELPNASPAVSPAAFGRIKYNNTTKQFEASNDGSAYGPIATDIRSESVLPYLKGMGQWGEWWIAGGFRQNPATFWTDVDAQTNTDKNAEGFGAYREITITGTFAGNGTNFGASGLIRGGRSRAYCRFRFGRVTDFAFWFGYSQLHGLGDPTVANLPNDNWIGLSFDSSNSANFFARARKTGQAIVATDLAVVAAAATIYVVTIDFDNGFPNFSLYDSADALLASATIGTEATLPAKTQELNVGFRAKKIAAPNPTFDVQRVQVSAA